MSRGYTLSPRALADIEENWVYTARQWDIDQAESYVSQLAKHCAALADRPGLGRACPEIRDGYYRYPSGSHIVFYCLTNAGLEVVRFLHERMDASQRLYRRTVAGTPPPNRLSTTTRRAGAGPTCRT